MDGASDPDGTPLEETMRALSNAWKTGLRPARWLAVAAVSALLPAVAAAETYVELQTSEGRIVIELHPEVAPRTVANFLAYVDDSFYAGTVIHRVIPGFMVQGGDPDSKTAAPGAALGKGGPDYTLPAEVVPSRVHTKGALAAARQADEVNPERRSSGSQFYLVQGKTYAAADLEQVAARNARYGTPVNYTEEQKQAYATKGGAPHLDGAYTVFGEVVEGLDVLDAVALTPCDGRDRPLSDLRFYMRILE